MEPVMNKKPKPEPFERVLSEYAEAKIKWLWRYLIPENIVCIFEGEGEVGKSRVARWLAAQLSSGLELPGEDVARPAANVLICSFSEDPVEQITRPQIRKMGGDLKRVFVVEQPFTLDPAGLGKLTDAIQRRQAKLVILDPLSDYIPSRANAHRDEEVRRFVMGPLSLLARKLKLTIIAIRHWKKSREDGVKYRGAGSMAFSNVARITLAFIADPEAAKDEQMFVLGLAKSNWVPKSKRKFLRFEIGETSDEIGRLRWRGESERSIEQLDAEWRELTRGGEGTAEAKDFLLGALKHGPVEVNVLKEKRPEDISWRTVERAKRVLKVVTRGGHRGKPAEWLLREHAKGIVIDFSRAKYRKRYDGN
jgi:hypothetical protein